MVHIAREAPTHALMIAVMVWAMVSGSALVSVLGAGMLVAASIVCAALLRARPFLRDHVVDLWAMALVLLVFLPHGSAVGHHAMTLQSGPAFAAIMVAWGGARVWLARRYLAPAQWRMPVASGALTGAGLALMALLCA